MHKFIIAMFGLMVVTASVMPTPALASDPNRCRYTYDDYKGKEVIMHSSLRVSVDDETPSGEMTPKVREIMRVNFTAQSGCDDITIDGYGFRINAEDTADSGWRKDLKKAGVYAVDVETGKVVSRSQFGWMTSWRDTTVGVAFKMSGFTVEAGENRTIAFYADVSDASASKNDNIQAAIMLDSLAWHDDYGRLFRQDHKQIWGESIWF